MTTYSAVVTTGIYCRPGCGAKPLTHNTRTFEHAAAILQVADHRRKVTIQEGLADALHDRAA